MFLALTAIDEFWDKDKEILFLHDACRRFDRKDRWRNLEHKVEPFIWTGTDKVTNAIEYCDLVYEKTLKELTVSLNNYHGINKDTKYYRIILGYWLCHFIHQLYDKYLSLKNVLEKHPDIDTWVLDKGQFYTPSDVSDSIKNIAFDDRYSLQQYSQILNAMGCDFEAKKLSAPLRQMKIYYRRPPLRSKIYDGFQKVLLKIVGLLRDKMVILTDHSFPSGPDCFKVFLKSGFKCFTYFFESDFKINLEFDREYRAGSLNLNSDEFESVLSKVLLFNLPAIFLEGFCSFRKVVNRIPVRKSSLYFTVHHLTGDNLYKFFIGEHYKDIKVSIMQHGGGYGIDTKNVVEEYEKSISDVFYTSGWKENDSTVPLSNTKILNCKLQYKNIVPNPETILFSMSFSSRYIYRLQLRAMGPDNDQENIDVVIRFLGLTRYRDKVLVRGWPKDMNDMNMKEKIMEEYGDCKIDDLSENFIERLGGSRVFITNSISTTYLEALALNKPTIIFINKKIQAFRPDAITEINKLKEAGIVHYSPEAAADFLDEVYEDVDKWWQRKDVQGAKNDFVRKFAYTTPEWHEEWIKEFNRALSEK